MIPMTHRGTARSLAAIAVQGLLVGCGAQPTQQAIVDVEPPAARPEYPPAPTASASVAAPPSHVEPQTKACCRGTNDCKGRGQCKTAVNECRGMNECKGQGGCAAAECHVIDRDPEKACCKGLNDCKGKGQCKTDAHNCKGLNQCKGQGGCAPSGC